ncbi:MAG: hypothetical protein CXT77_04375 [uncultured DHVE6 group euryarchaeote]|nr:MAG: hypothetical protein CXT77_04375 [uncultured DHVE6 group euryarchaeote]
MVKKSQKQQKKRVETQEYAILGILSLAIASIFVFSVFGFNFSGSGLATFNLVVDAATGCTVDQNGALSAIGGTENVTVTDVNGATKDGTPFSQIRQHQVYFREQVQHFYGILAIMKLVLQQYTVRLLRG